MSSNNPDVSLAGAEHLDLSRAPLLAHLIELRRRLLWVLLCFGIAFIAAYASSEHIYAFLAAPLAQAFGEGTGRRMIYTGLHEAFLVYLKVAFFTAVFVSMPLAINQLWKFIAPGLYDFERAAMRPFFWGTPILFLTGAALAYYVVFPLACEFFLSFENTAPNGVTIELEARISEYLTLVMWLILAFGLSFELPLLLLLLARLGMITHEDLALHRKHAIVLIFAAAAIITPPDLISQIALGTPLVLLYEGTIWMLRWSGAESLSPRSRAFTARGG
jgi:sec-independent protein translocase protein TatC